MSEFLERFKDASMPFQNWKPFPDEAIVQVKNVHGDSVIDVAKNLWWGYERDNYEGVITRARRLDMPKEEFQKKLDNLLKVR